MKLNNLYNQLKLLPEKGEKWLAVLIDPEDVEPGERLIQTLRSSESAGANLLLAGGSLVNSLHFKNVISFVRKNTYLPVYLFPGSALQIHEDADGILFLSLISGRNPELLIGQHVQVAPALKKSGLNVISCGYMLIDGNRHTSVSYISQTLPIPADKPELAVAIALAGEMLGLQTLYLETGSGAHNAVPANMIQEVRKQVKIPIFTGGGLKTPEDVLNAWHAGADVAVVGTAIEKNPDWLREFAMALKPHACSKK